ncbi:unnamed protein product [Dibothriocephalus latus]|uniref:Uncharacterized protein n=1 Tax=Dibothriocephalus latus TaxID=60516 RepID=A0A3P7LYY6_DIBLA|nr:unnamed protein product [Dibothriocephalus latus]
MRLDLSVQNQDGGFSPVVVLLPESEPGTPHFTTDYLKKDTATRSEQGLGKLDNQELDDGLSDEPPRTIMLERPTSVLDASLKPEPSTGIEIEPAVPTENYCDTPPTPLRKSKLR